MSLTSLISQLLGGRKLSKGQRNDCRHRLRLERLEAREVFSGLVGMESPLTETISTPMPLIQEFSSLAVLRHGGEVSAIVRDGWLIIQGDSVSNGIGIHRGIRPGEVVVEGTLCNFNDLPTNVNGQDKVVLEGVTHGIRIEMGGGDDSVEITDLVVPGDLIANMGDGNDRLAMGYSETAAQAPQGMEVRVFGNVNVVGGEGDDKLELTQGIEIEGNFYFSGRQGNDTFTLGGNFHSVNDIHRGIVMPNGIAAPISIVHGNLTVDLGDGNDVVSLNQQRINDFDDAVTQPLLGSAHLPFLKTHVGGWATFNTGGGDDFISLDNLTSANLRIHSGEGGEGQGLRFGVSLTNIEVRDKLTVNTGGGLDNVLLDGIDAGEFTLNTDTDSDGVVAKNVKANYASIIGDSGGDVVGIYDSVFESLALDLGADYDTLYTEHNSVYEDGFIQDKVNAQAWFGRENGFRFIESPTKNMVPLVN